MKESCVTTENKRALQLTSAADWSVHKVAMTVTVLVLEMSKNYLTLLILERSGWRWFQIFFNNCCHIDRFYPIAGFYCWL